ncbi:MAG TPA: metallophosphoesterase [Terracidiphilus sp.]|jgi:predicted phosphodiesterase
MNRRQFLTTASLAAGATLTATRSDALSSPGRPGSFDFLFITDTHIEPELDAPHGCDMAFAKAAHIKADFAIHGGDHVFDAMAVDRKRADSLFDLYAHAEQALGVKVHHTIGNHDQFAILAKSGLQVNSRGYGKELYKDRVGPTYYSFDHEGYHFVVLDTVQATEDRSWEARIDAPQLQWLKTDLGAIAPATPVVAIAHVPLVSGVASYGESHPASVSADAPKHPQLIVDNAYEVVNELQKHNTLAVFQGHTHLNEVVTFRGIHYVTSGAVCGNWWHGTRWGTPEGFTVVSLRAGKVEWRYETSGFKTVDPQNT